MQRLCNVVEAIDGCAVETRDKVTVDVYRDLIARLRQSLEAVRPQRSEPPTSIGLADQQPSRSPDTVLLDYAIPHPLAAWSPSLWIAVGPDGVSSAEAKRYPLVADEHAVFALRRNMPKWSAADFETTFRHP